MDVGRKMRRVAAATMSVGALALVGTACNGPFGPSTAPGPIVGTLQPVIVGGVPESTATALTREVCTPYSVIVTVQIEHNEHPVEIVLDHHYPLVGDLSASVEPGGGTVQFQALDECFRVQITHLDLGTTGDDLDYRIDWVLAPTG